MAWRFGPTLTSYTLGLSNLVHWLLFVVGAILIFSFSASIGLGYVNDDSFTLTGTALVFVATIAGLTLAYASIVEADDPLRKKSKLTTASESLLLAVALLIISTTAKYASIRIMASSPTVNEQPILAIVTIIYATARFSLVWGTTTALFGAAYLFATLMPISQVNPRHHWHEEARRLQLIKESLSNADEQLDELDSMIRHYQEMLDSSTEESFRIGIRRKQADVVKLRERLVESNTLLAGIAKRCG